jgi:uncharacterized protein involved in type VI secretion and phage assembly
MQGFFGQDLDSEQNSSKIYGVVTGVVTNNKDEEGLARVKVTFPWLAENDESHWARIATMMAGSDRGSYFIPEVGDEVLVAFEHGDIHYPYIIGALWNGKDKPHETNDDGKNNLRVIKSRSGHKIILDDTEGKENITVIDKDEQRKIILDSANKVIDIINEDGTINIQAGGAVNISAGENVNIKANKNIKAEAKQNIETDAKASMKFKASASGNVEAGSSLTVKASGVTTVKGSLVKLN